MKTISLLLLVSSLFFIGCADNKTIKGHTYRPYGFLNETECKSDSIHYEIPLKVIVSSILFSDLIIPPIYNIGYNLYEPKCLNKDYCPGKNSIIN